MAEGEFIEATDLGSNDELPSKATALTGSLKQTRVQAELSAIELAIKRCNGNKTAAAKLLGISRANLYSRLKQEQTH